jgi:hypothetical protein
MEMLLVDSNVIEGAACSKPFFDSGHLVNEIGLILEFFCSNPFDMLLMEISWDESVIQFYPVSAELLLS